MSEFLNGLSNKTWFITIISFLAANFGTILAMVLIIIKNKIKTANLNNQIEEKLAKNGIELNQELLDKIEKIETKLEDKTNEMLDTVFTKLKIDSEEKKASVEANTLQIQELIKETTNKITESLKEE